MGKKNQPAYFGRRPPQPPKPFTSLADAMEDGREYGSLADKTFVPVDVSTELRRGLAEIEAVRKRPAVLYAGNTVRDLSDVRMTSIERLDHLPFAELIDGLPKGADALDLIIETPGGLVQQVSHFVGRLRPRFRDVSVIVLNMAMSAGTIWALSANEIWMDERAFLGPIDPQVPGKDGRLVPAQAILTLLDRIQQTGEDALKAGGQPPWSDIQILHNVDAKEIGNAIAQTEYATQLAAKYLETHKFRDWSERETTKAPVTGAQRAARALEVATKLCSHQEWKVHSHGISRDVVEREVQLRIEHPEDTPDFHRALRRTAAMLRWVFENSFIAKIQLSQMYASFRIQKEGAT